MRTALKEVQKMRDWLGPYWLHLSVLALKNILIVPTPFLEISCSYIYMTHSNIQSSVSDQAEHMGIIYFKITHGLSLWLHASHFFPNHLKYHSLFHWLFSFFYSPIFVFMYLMNVFLLSFKSSADRNLNFKFLQFIYLLVHREMFRNTRFWEWRTDKIIPAFFT